MEREEPPINWPDDEVVQGLLAKGYLRPGHLREDFLALWHAGLIDVATDRQGLAKYDTILHVSHPKMKKVIW